MPGERQHFPSLRVLIQMLPRQKLTEREQELLDTLSRETFSYFLQHGHEKTGLVADNSQPGSAASITATGMALSCYIVAVERGWLKRTEAAEKTVRLLDFLFKAPQGKAADATGYKGFFYHFLDMKTGRRAGQCELSTIDTAFLIAGALSAKEYFSADDYAEREIRKLAEALYLQVDWLWATNGSDTLTHGWKPKPGFLKYRWNSEYSEALLMYALALGSPTHSISLSGYLEWTNSFRTQTFYGLEQLYAGPLFIHQLSQIWIDCRSIGDDFNRRAGFSYFENSCRATRLQREYAIDNPKGFAGYGSNCWGITASDGPGPARRQIKGKKYSFFNYKARGVPYGPDDGTVAPWAVVASLPFAPEMVMEMISQNRESASSLYEWMNASHNPTFRQNAARSSGWISDCRYGINLGPAILMIDNFQSGLLWKLMCRSSFLREGLLRAGFTGGWLHGKDHMSTYRCL